MNPADPVDRAVELLAEARKLTPAETELVRLGAACVCSHRDLAKVRGVSRSTIKEQIRAILEKTGRTSLLELVRDVLLVAVGLAHSSPATKPPDGGGGGNGFVGVAGGAGGEESRGPG